MTISVAPSEFNTLAALRMFLIAILPNGTDVIRGQANRVPEPAGADFVVMSPLRHIRLSTNVDEFVDAKLRGSFIDETLTVSAIDYGGLKVGSVVFGVGVLAGTTVLRQVAANSYTVSRAQDLADRVLAAGIFNAMVSTEFTIQLDVHGPASADNAQRVNTLLRDQYAWKHFADQGLGVYPLTCEDPNLVPFINDSNQYEDRWVVEACLTAETRVQDVPQEFFDQIVPAFIPPDIFYAA